MCVPNDTIYRELWESKNRIVEPGQIHYQVRKLRKAINESVNDRDELIKTITKHGLVLDLSPDQVLIVGRRDLPRNEGLQRRPLQPAYAAGSASAGVSSNRTETICDTPRSCWVTP